MRPAIKTVGIIVHGTIVSSAFAGACLALYFKAIPTDQKDLALILLGALISEFRSVGSFWTGSTASSQAQQQTIADIATTKGTGAGNG